MQVNHESVANRFYVKKTFRKLGTSIQKFCLAALLTGIMGVGYSTGCGRNEEPKPKAPTTYEQTETKEQISKIVFASMSNKRGIYLMNADGSNVTQLTDGGVMPSWSPDGKTIAYMTFKEEDMEMLVKYGLTFHQMLYTMDVHGGNQKRAVSVPVSLFTWSPDGKKIAVTSGYEDSRHFGKDGLMSSAIYVSDLDGKEPNRLTAVLGTVSGPDWSPDGKQIAYSAQVARRTGDIFIMNEDGSDKRRVARGYSPKWSPDGRKIAFMSDKGVEEQLPSQSNIYIMDADGKNQRKLTNSAAYKHPLSWSPDGRKILFSSGEEIYVIDSDGSNQINLTNNPARDLGGSFSPDGKKVLYRTNKDGNWEIYAVSVDGGKPVNLTNSSIGEMNPSWSP